MTTRYHICVSVRGALKWSDANLRGMFKDEGGRTLSGAETREVLFDALSEGKEVLPIGPCDNFNFKVGCQGHPKEAADVKPFPNRSSALESETAPVAAGAVSSTPSTTYEEVN